MKKIFVYSISSPILFLAGLYFFIDDLLVVFSDESIPREVICYLPDNLVGSYYWKVFDGSRSPELEHDGIMSLLESDLSIDPYLDSIFRIVSSNPDHVMAASHLILADKIDPNPEIIANLLSCFGDNQKPNHIKIVTGLALYQYFDFDHEKQREIRSILEKLGVTSFPGEKMNRGNETGSVHAI